MSGFGTTFTQNILGWISGTDMATAPVDVYLALFDGDPTNAGSGGTEVTTDIAAARPAITFGAASGKTMANSAVIDFGTSAGTVSVTHAAIFDAASAGNFIASGPLQTPRDITAGDPVSVLVGDLTIGLTG